MTREQLAHVLRAVAKLSGERDVLVIGSQSILGSYPEGQLPPQATGSMEVDTAFFTDPDGATADLVDVNIGEFSEFHNEFGYYPQGVSISTGVFRPAGGTAWLPSTRPPANRAAGCAWNHTTASWPSSSGSTTRTRTSPAH
jgi:hypothetical protein